MNKAIKKPYIILFLVLFFFTVPLFQSLIFSTHSDGTMHIDKEVHADFLQSEKKYILLYFGYVGCAEVCTPFLDKLSTLYRSKEFHALKENTDIFFVNLTSKIEPSQADMFAKAFNKNFKGVYLSKKELFSLDREYGLFYSDDLSDTTALNHTDYLYLLENNKDSKLLKKIYFTHPLKSKNLIDDIIHLTKLGDKKQ